MNIIDKILIEIYKNHKIKKNIKDFKSFEERLHLTKERCKK